MRCNADYNQSCVYIKNDHSNKKSLLVISDYNWFKYKYSNDFRDENLSLFSVLFSMLSHFLVDGFSLPYRLDSNVYGSGILAYFKNNITMKPLTTKNLSTEIETLFIEINLRNKKWLLCFTYSLSKKRWPVVTIAMICPTLASSGKLQSFQWRI